MRVFLIVCASRACVQGDDKQAAAMAANGGMQGMQSMQGMQMAPFFAPPGAFFNPMMQVRVGGAGVEQGRPPACPQGLRARGQPG